MRNKLLRSRYDKILIGISLLLVTFAGSVQAQDNDIDKPIDAVWSQSDGIRPEIFYSQRQSGKWSEPVMLSDDYFDNMYPVIDQDSNAKKWLFWTAYDSQRMDIRYTTGQNGVWEDSVTLVTDMKSNIAPSVIIDKEDTVWLVWSAYIQGSDDIFYATNKDGSWSEPVRIHVPNNMPDVLPVIELNADNMPVVGWTGFREGKYVALESEWDGTAWSDGIVVTEVESPEQEEDSSADYIELPDFMPPSGMVFLRVY